MMPHRIHSDQGEPSMWTLNDELMTQITIVYQWKHAVSLEQFFTEKPQHAVNEGIFMQENDSISA